MKLTLLVLLAAGFLLFLSFMWPPVFALGYIWLSVLSPQYFTEPFFASLRLPMVFGLFSILGFFFNGYWRDLRLSPTFVATALFAGWVTLTNLWAVFPAAAWVKWDWAFKSILIAIILPLFFRSRQNIEMIFLVVVFAIAAHVGVAGTKSIFGGGGYGKLRPLMDVNHWLGESSTLATVAVMSIPLVYYGATRAEPLLRLPFRRLGFLVYTAVALAALVGSGARSGLVALAALITVGVPRIGGKIAVITGAVALAFILRPILPTDWQERMATIFEYQSDSSAMGRVEAWRWALGYAASHPLGGGFRIERLVEINVTVEGGDQQRVIAEQGKAFHSIIFEVLAEHGIVGLALYAVVLLGPALGLFRLARKYRNFPECEWLGGMASALFAADMAFLAGGQFIGVAFQPIAYIICGLYLCLLHADLQRKDLSFSNVGKGSRSIGSPVGVA
jgi:putative inorganic carbon (HCO3(-)) transporter